MRSMRSISTASATMSRRCRRDESREIPDWIDYAEIPGLSAELRQKLVAFRPTTIAQAQAIEGMTPAAVTLLLSIIRRGTLSKAAS